MPRRQITGPGPRSKVASSFLGESSATEAEASEAESFQSAELDANNTDYGLEYTSTDRHSRRTFPASKTTPQTQKTQNKGPSFERRTAFIPNNRPPIEATSSAPTKKSKKQKTPLRRDELMWKKIKQLQSRTDNITPKAPFGRLIRELLMQESSSAHRITYTALEALQISSEIYLTNLFSDAYVCTLHRGRVTLGVHDLRLVRFLRGSNDAGNKH